MERAPATRHKEKKRQKVPLILTERMEEILKLVYFYRFMTALDISRRLDIASITYVRDILARMAGGADFRTNQYLYRFVLPHVSSGGRERVYTLGALGRDYLARVAGMPVDWYFRPYKSQHLSFGQITHDLALTRFLVAAHVWCAKQPDFSLAETRTCYELARAAIVLEPAHPDSKRTLPVIPDAWLLFEKRKDGKRERSFPVVLEIDGGTQYQERFKRHIESRIEFVRSGGYKQLFETEAVLIAYATTGQTPDQRETRRISMCAWTREVLKKLHKEEWATIFRFHTLSLEDIYKVALFDGEVWHRPDSAVPEPLFGF